MMHSTLPRFLLLLTLPWLAAAGTVMAQGRAADDLSQQVEIRRTAFGVPHIKADNIEAAAYALAYVQLEDHGPRVAIGLLRGRGELARWFGRDSIESDFVAQREYAIAIERYPDLDQDTRDVYEGFAAGANRYIATHPQEFPADAKHLLHGLAVIRCESMAIRSRGRGTAHAPGAAIRGADRDAGAIAASRRNAERAGVATDIEFSAEASKEKAPSHK